MGKYFAQSHVRISCKTRNKIKAAALTIEISNLEKPQLQFLCSLDLLQKAVSETEEI